MNDKKHEIKTEAPPAKPMLELKMLLCGPGVMVSNTVGITDVAIKDLMAYPALHPDLLKAAKTGVTILAQQYNGVQPTNNVDAQHEADLKAQIENQVAKAA